MAKHIYVHIPFCSAKCPYCAFFSRADSANLIPSYFDALNEEIKYFASYKVPSGDIPFDEDDTCDTVYFGGGTPSLPESSYITRTLENILTLYNISPDNAEITIEANPYTITPEKLSAYRKAGFNRISIGVQALNNDVLKTLGRLHDSDRAIKAVEEAKTSGFTNISCDLMLGIPGQTYEMLIDSAEKLLILGVNHISMYSLMLEEGTPFEKSYGKYIEDVFEPDTEREMYHGLRKFLSDKGFVPYEISNCALPGFESRHNISYWRGVNYYAFGSGSAGYLGSNRFSHFEDIKAYIGNPICSFSTDETLDITAKMKEYAMLMLRMSSGISKKSFLIRFENDLEKAFPNELQTLINKGLAVLDDTSFKLTSKGLDFANEAFREFV